MSRRKPLAWYESDHGVVPDCICCVELMLSPMFAEACASVAIEYEASTAELTRRVINQFHERRHPIEMRWAGS